MTLEICPLTYKEACLFIDIYHRHHKPPQGYKFAIGVHNGERVVGVATIGRPVSRNLDNSWTAEVTRCCTDGTPHVASKLYAAAWRACRAMGYKRLVTYTLIEEPGTSLKAAGWTALYQTAGKSWDVPSRPRVDKHPLGRKTLWEVSHD